MIDRYIDKELIKTKLYEKLFLIVECSTELKHSIKEVIEEAFIIAEEESKHVCFTDIRTGKKYPFVLHTMINCFGNNENKVWIKGDMTKYIVVDDDQIEYYKLWINEFAKEEK